MGAAYCKNAWVKLRTHRLRPTFWLCSSDNKKYRKFQKIINLFFSDAGCNAACKLTWGRAVNIISAPEKSERKKKDDIAKHELRTMWHLPTLKKKWKTEESYSSSSHLTMVSRHFESISRVKHESSIKPLFSHQHTYCASALEGGRQSGSGTPCLFFVQSHLNLASCCQRRNMQ